MSTPTVTSLTKQIGQIKEQHQSEITELSRKYDERISKLTETIEKLQQDIPKIIAAAVEKAIHATVESMKNSIKQVAIETASAVEKSFLDLLEKKEKKKNLVVVGMNEGDDASDWDKVCQMAQSSGIEAPEIAIKTVFRDGAAGK
jgi:vacuolar-type H+-ATPase subunit I/STV1